MAPTSWRKKTGCCQESMSRHGKVCRDKQQYVVTSSSMSRHRRPVSRQVAVCRDIDDQCRDMKPLSRPETLQKPKKNRNLIFLTKFQAHFTLGPYIYTRFLGKEATGKIGEPLMGFLSLDCPFFQFFTEKVSPLQ